MNFEQILVNKIFCRMFDLVIIEVMTLSGHLSNINEINPHLKSVSQTYNPQHPQLLWLFCNILKSYFESQSMTTRKEFWRKTFQGKYSRCFLKTGQEYFRTLRWGTTLIYFCESHSKNSQFQAFKKELRAILVTKDNQKNAQFLSSF